MAPFSIPTPSVIPLRLPVFGGPKSIDTETKIQILCETYLEHEIFYTLDGTKPQPYAGIVQGNKTIKYTSPFCLPAGKITIKAMAISSVVHTMCSNTVTKCFDVRKIESSNNEASRIKKSKSSKSKKNSVKSENEKNADEAVCEKEEKLPDISDDRYALLLFCTNKSLNFLIVDDFPILLNIASDLKILINNESVFYFEYMVLGEKNKNF